MQPIKILKIPEIKNFILLTGIYTLIPLWNIPHTIAGRYICEFLLLFLIISYKLDWRSFFEKNKFLILFFLYLVIQLAFFSINYESALKNFFSEWFHFIIFTIVGGGVGLILNKKKVRLTLLCLGIAFAIPPCLHLILFTFKAIVMRSIPWGYTGINEIHGDLGYSALQATIFLCCHLLYNKDGGYKKISALLIVLVLLSPILARSRGGILFTSLSITFLFLVNITYCPNSKVGTKKLIMTCASALILISSIYQISRYSDQHRWYGFLSRVESAFKVEPLNFFCNSMDLSGVDFKLQTADPMTLQRKNIDELANGDGARVLVARVGITLTEHFPMGIDQSKKAYQEAIKIVCRQEPKISISHTHNGWLDTSLAIGIPGAIILLLVFLKYGAIGFQHIKSNKVNCDPFAAALLGSSFMWTLRGGFDSTQRDQMLEMQAFVFALLLGLVVKKRGE